MIVCVCVLLSIDILVCIQIYITMKENKRLNEQNRLLKEQCQSLEPKITHIRKLRHDIVNHLYVMGQLVRTETTEEYYCNDAVVDSAIRGKMTYGKQKKINITYNIAKISMEKIERIELLSLICNVLDNAIEACEDIQNQENRWIYFSVKKEKNGVLIECTNSRNPKIQLKQGERTTKKDKKAHGIGNEIIKDIVNKYNGTTKVKAEPECYSLLIKGLLL